LVEELRKAGHDVAWVREINRAMPDPDIVDLSIREDRIILTADKGFGTMVFYLGKSCPGVILTRIRNLTLRNHRVLSVLAERGGGLRGNFSVITDSAVRMRKMQ
jgi:predicted nuclease of predicted toxin-antitoxin system